LDTRQENCFETTTAKLEKLCGRIVILLLLLIPAGAMGQVIPAMKAAPHYYGFGTYSYGHSDWNSDTIYGFTLGGFMQTSHIWGVELRGSMLRWGSQSAQEDIAVGPRGALSFGRFTFYGAPLFGAANARWQGTPGSSYNRSTIGAEWKVLGGADFRLTRKISIRLGEASYSRIYILRHGLTPTTFSTGVVFRLR
jgi:hypothetical protein